MRPDTPAHANLFLFLARTLTLLILLLGSSLALSAQEPVKSPNDNNQYRFIELDNGLRAILVSDKGAEKAAASMNVSVGSGDDPKDREGLAHFLEHMLFLGTEKYPEPGEYQQFIKSHGGSHNAFTAFQNTNYFFDIQAQFLEPALDRFAQQFAAPLFTPELVERERHAVHSEFSARRKEDSRRFYSVKKAASNPDHAFSRFAVGNLTTLENTEARPLRPDLIKFWRNHYSANLMTLAVYGPQSLDQLETMVRARFQAIANRELKPKQHSAPLYAPESLPSRVTAQALKDVRSLNLSFPIPSQETLYRSKPASYIASLLGHEGPGSLLDVLKRAGLVENLSAGIGIDTGENATLELSMSLTPEGLKQQDRILALVFDDIDIIRRQGISKQRFDEMRKLARIDFRFREKGEPLHEVMALSSQLQRYPVQDILSAPWLMEDYIPEQYREILDYLTPENLMVFVLDPNPELENPNITRWYDTPWSREALDPDKLRATPVAALATQLQLPAPNPFIPENLEMVTGASMAKPVLLASPNGLDLWYDRDTRFGTPKANIFISLRTPATRASARNSILTRLLVDAINTNLNPWGYQAHLAGLDYSVYPHLRGITIRVGGYSDKLHTLMNRILAQIANPGLSQQRFDIARQNLLDSLRNQTRNPPVKQTSGFVQNALLQGAWSVEEKLQAASEVTLQELQAFARTLLTEVQPVMLAHGNLSQAAALNVAQLVNSLVLAHSKSTEVPRSRMRQLPLGETLATLEVDHPDTGYTLYMQGANTSFTERARYRLLAQIISSPFYENIRTTRQLGYIVYAMPFEILEAPALGFVVQSPSADWQDLDQAVREFATGFENRLAALDDASLEREKQAVISKLLQQDRQLGDASDRLWREIDRNATGFDSREQLAEAIRQVSKADLLETYRASVLNRERSLLVVTGADKANADKVRAQIKARPPLPEH